MGDLPAAEKHPHCNWTVMPATVAAEDILLARSRIGDDIIKCTTLDVDWQTDLAPLLLHVDVEKIKLLIYAEKVTLDDCDQPPMDMAGYDAWRFRRSPCYGSVWIALYEDIENCFRFVSVSEHDCCDATPRFEIKSHASPHFATLWNTHMDASERYCVYTMLYDIQSWIKERVCDE